MKEIDLDAYDCEKCGKRGVCEEAMDAFVACLCLACFEELWAQYVAELEGAGDSKQPVKDVGI